MKIKYKLFYIPGLFVTLFLLVVFTSFFYQSGQSLNTSMLNFQHILVESSAKNTNEHMEKHIELVAYLQTLEEIKDMREYGDISAEYKGLSDQQGVNVRRLFKKMLELFPDFAYFATYTKDKAINVVYEPYSEQLNLTEEDYYRGFSYRDWYSEAMRTGTTYTSEAYMSASIAEPVVAISTPIFVGEEISGIMIGALKLATLSERLAELNFGRTGHSYIIDKKRQIVAHPDPKYFKANRLFKVTGGGVIDIVTQMTDAEPPAQLLKAIDPMSGHEVYFSFSKLDSTGWTIITQISVDEVQEPIINMYKTIVLPSILIVPLFLALVFLSVRGVVQRLEFLSKISKKISNDNFNISSVDRDYMLKNSHNTDESYHLLNNFSSMVDRLNQSFSNIDFLARHDQLTGLPNRRSFYSDNKTYIESGRNGAIIIFDLDDFKIINDTKGHKFGDQVLVKVASRLKTDIDEHVYISRFGGDEFLACLKIEDKAALEAAVSKLHRKMTTVIELDGLEVDLNCSMGVSMFPEHGMDIDELVKASDLALFKAKQSGKKRYDYYSAILQKKVMEEADIERCIRDALVTDGFQLVYQPQVNPKNNQVVAFEALIRMKSGKYHPGQFIPVAEKYGHISRIGRWTVTQTVKQLSQWKKKGLDIKPVSVNYSAAQFVDKGFLDFVRGTLSQYGVAEKYLELEITEGLFVKPMSDVTHLLHDFSKMGIKLSIDDFGTGYSSIGYLMTLPVNKVKLDRSLCVNYLNDDDYSVIKSIILLVKSFDMAVVAEGIEDRVGVERLKSLDCDIIQGYYFDKPLEANAAQERLAENYGHLTLDFVDKESNPPEK